MRIEKKSEKQMKGSHVQRFSCEESRLYEAAAIGKVADLRELIVNNPLILDRVSYTSCPNKTPLHIATLKGHLPFVQEILSLNPQLAEELDSQQSSALHIASDKGHVEIVKKLLLAAPDMCLSRDVQGRNPLHLAAVKGQVEVLIELVQSVPLAARQKLDRGSNVLHLCVEYNQLGALKILVPFLNELINARGDDHGDTILHMAVRDKQNETIQYLVERTNIDVNAQNSEGQTAFEILEQSPRDTRNSQIREILTTGLRKSNTQTRPEKWPSRKSDVTMLVAVLIATMAFQAVVSPAGGVWQDDMFNDSQGNLLLVPRRAGEAVMAHKHPRAFMSFICSNTIAFLSSLSTILFLISGLPFKNRLVMWALMVFMWLTVTSTAVTYTICIVVITPRKDRKSVGHFMDTSIAVWCGVMGILLVMRITVLRPKRFRSSIEGNYENSSRRENV